MRQKKGRLLGIAEIVILATLFTVSFWPTKTAVAQSQRGEQNRPRGTSAQTVPVESEAGQGSDVEKNNPVQMIAPQDKAQVTSLRFLSSKSYTRIMLELSQETKYEVRRLKEDVPKGMPPRIYVDIAGAQLALVSKELVPVDDGLLRQVRVGQYSADVVRIVLDMHTPAAYNAYILADPVRLVIDVQGSKPQEKATSRVTPINPEAAGRKSNAKVSQPTATVPPTNGIRKIVLDPGHGGKDPGAIGAGGIAEKDIVLSIARKLALKLRREMGVQVVLTRKDDRFVPLEDRTALANKENADLFISLHMNASENSEAKGVETYYLDKTTDEAANRLAARENATSQKNISDLQFILADMKQNVKMEDSITLAHQLQGSIVEGMAKVMDVKDLGVKKAIFHVLVGAYMPCVLVEMFFVTHRSEGRAMSQPSNQDAVVEALFEGIQKYGQSNLLAKTL